MQKLTDKIYAWVDGVELEQQALEQLQKTSSLPIVYDHVAVMPDVHWGIGSTVGSVIATRGAIIPAAVGVDIGCGMVAARINIKVDQLPDLHDLRTKIEAAVPHGRTDNGGNNDRGAWGTAPTDVQAAMIERFKWPIADLVGQHPKIAKHGDWMNLADRATRQLATLGTGNHFIEVCRDEEDSVWIMLHSGSRGLGNILASYFIEAAKEQAARFQYEGYLPDKDLAWLSEGTPIFDAYIQALNLAQEYAAYNRNLMLSKVLVCIPGAQIVEEAVNCHHNYVAKERHYGKDLWITRKGAVRAREGDLGIIPGSMGAKSFIVSGKGNAPSFTSCSHGAGRRLGRNAAKRAITMDQFEAAMVGVESRKDAEVLDEAPQAYKDIDAVMAAQSDLVDIKHTLRQLIVVKG